MCKKLIKYLKKFSSYLIYNISSKRVILNLLFVFFIFLYKDFFNSIIYDYLTPVVFNINFLSFSTYLTILLIITVGIWYKVFKDNYNFSINEINSILIALFLLLNFNYFNSDKKWNLSSFEIIGLKIELSFLLLVVLILILVFIIIYNCFFRKKVKQINLKSNYLLSDSPITNDDDDILDYQETVDKLTRILKNDNHNKSFTIGLVGPWGNGKSSVFQMVKKRLIKNDKNKKNDFIIFDFLPYLNHNEDDIINEFFTSLSNELRPYSGKLSNLLNEYSSKLTDLYENKNVLGFIENHVTNFKDSSANELYQLINEMLIDIDKKIIVFVDDLDRLNKNEILQVLKLIRNTADFRNIIFVVAMDKEYVLKSLKKSKKIFHSSFIDKFFQLEIYLPEIDKTKLRENFILGMKSSPLNNGSPDFEFKILNAINNEGNLFNDYVKNIRDVKRLVNQVIYDYPNTGGEINLKDFLNFTYFKLKFPNFINILKYGIGDFIEIKHGLYKLKVFDPDNKKDDNSSRSDKIFSILSKQNSFDPKKYELYKEEFFNNCLLENQIIDCENRFLLIKTLAFLFGDENKVNDVSSIKDEKNLRILLEQKVPKNRLLNIEFEFLLSSSLDILVNIIEEFHRDNKIDQLLSRFKFFTASKNENEYKNAILTLVYIYAKRKDFSIYEATIIDQIGVFAHKLVSKEEVEGLNKDIKQWSLENIFKKDFFNIETRILLFGHLRNGALGSKFEVTHWSFEKEELDDLTVKLFQEYIDDCASLITNPNDYSLYYVYHTIKSGIEDTVREMIIEFWRKSNLELLCAQTTDLDTWSSLSFKISDVIDEFFKTKSKYIEFVKFHKDSSKNEIKEFLDLYEFLEISNFYYNCMFTFKNSTLMLEKIEFQKQSRRGRDENQELIQIIIETNSLSFIESFRKHNDFERKYGSRVHEKEFDQNRLYYIFVYLKKSLSHNPVLTYLQDLHQAILPLTDWGTSTLVEKNIDNRENLFTHINKEYYLKLKSIEPENKTNLN
jgi:hypothetical protein